MRRTRLIVAAAVVAVVLLVVLAPVASAAPRTAAAGVWTWEGYGEPVVKAHPGGNTILIGTEHGWWTGTFEGASDESFFAVFTPTGGLWAKMMIDFTGSANGVEGGFTMALTVFATPGSETMNGHWVIQNGSGGLRHLHGNGMWLSRPNQSVADYAGSISLE